MVSLQGIKDFWGFCEILEEQGSQWRIGTGFAWWIEGIGWTP